MLSGKCPFGEKSGLGIVRRGIVRSGKCPVGEMSVGEMSVGEMSGNLEVGPLATSSSKRNFLRVSVKSSCLMKNVSSGLRLFRWGSFCEK